MSWQTEWNWADWDQFPVKINSINESNMRGSGYRVTKWFISHRDKEAIDKNQQKEMDGLYIQINVSGN